MATVTNNVTRFDAIESGSTVTGIGGGPGPVSDAAVFVQGSASWSRRQSSRTDHGLAVDRGATVDLSAANMHICYWHQHLNGGQGILSDIRFLLGTSTANDQHTFANADYPATGGFFPVWIDVSRTPENTAGAGATESACDYAGVQVDIGSATGQTNNIYLDAIQYTTTGYALTGTSGLFSDFTSFEDTNRFGVLVDQAGGLAVYARLTLGTASSLVFNDSNFGLTFPDQALVSSTFMGVTVDLQNASTDIDWSNGLIQSKDPSGATNRPDLVITGTSGAFDADVVTLNGLRLATFTSACSFTNGTIANTGVVTGAGCDFGGTSFLESTVAAGVGALLWNVNNNPDTELDGTTFSIGGNAHHAIEFGTSSSTTIDLNNITFTGFDTTDGNTSATDAVLYFRDRGSDTSWTVNVSGVTGTISYRKERAGDTVTVVNAVTVTLTGLQDNTEVRVMEAGSNTVELAGTENATDGTSGDRSFSFSLTAATVVDIYIVNVTYENVEIEDYTVPSSAASLPIQQRFDRSYFNP